MFSDPEYGTSRALHLHHHLCNGDLCFFHLPPRATPDVAPQGGHRARAAGRGPLYPLVSGVFQGSYELSYSCFGGSRKSFWFALPAPELPDGAFLFCQEASS